MRRAALLALATAGAVLTGVGWGLPRLGDPLPPGSPQPEAQLIVVYSHDCGDLGALWERLGSLQQAAPGALLLLQAEGPPRAAPPGLNVWRGAEAQAYARKLRVRAYPSAVLVRGGRIHNLWEGSAVQGGAFLEGLELAGARPGP